MPGDAHSPPRAIFSCASGIFWLRWLKYSGTLHKIKLQAAMARSKSRSSYVVRFSGIHGNGVFSKELIRKGTRIIEYRGIRSTIDVEREKPVNDPQNPHHTFLFELSDGTAIEAGISGNAARWINHGCAPNCEAIEEDGRVFIYARRTIRAGEEFTYDYRLSIPGRISQRTRQAYACYCGANACRGSMLMEPSSTNR
jgi:SET domain-containing protein